MEIAIVDTQVEGHHLEYIYGLSTKIIERENKMSVDLFCGHQIFDYIKTNNLAEFSKHRNFKIKTGKLVQPEGNWFRKTKIAYCNISQISEYNHVLFLYANVYFPALVIFALFHKPKFQPVGIYFNPYIREGQNPKNWIKTATLKLLLKLYPSLRLFVLNDEYAVRKLNEKFRTDAFRLLKDPIPEFYYGDNCQIANQKDNYTKFTMLGSISERKGVFHFLNAISKTKGNNRFILAGKIEKKIIDCVSEEVNQLKQDGYNIDLNDQFLSNREFAQYVSETDVLVIPYLSTGASSGILGHAAYKNKFVIGPEKGFIGKLIREYNLGYTIDPDDINSFANVMQAFNKGKRPAGKYGGQKYASENSLKQFSKKIISELI